MTEVIARFKNRAGANVNVSAGLFTQRWTCAGCNTASRPYPGGATGVEDDAKAHAATCSKRPD